jgi:hypothetical protein
MQPPPRPSDSAEHDPPDSASYPFELNPTPPGVRLTREGARNLLWWLGAERGQLNISYILGDVVKAQARPVGAVRRTLVKRVDGAR